MKYKCHSCEASEWRGYFPPEKLHFRYAVVNGIGIGICGIATKAMFASFGHTTDGWRLGLASLGICALLLLAFWAVVVIGEAIFVAAKGCQACGSHFLWIAPDS